MSNSKILVAFLGGAAAGALLGVLFAPSKGSEMREDITKKARDIADVILARAEEIVDEAEAAASKVKSARSH